MNERVFTLLCALGAVLLFIGMFVRREGGLEQQPTYGRPTSLERRADGYFALQHWLTAEHIPTVSIQRPLTEVLAQQPSSGNILLITLPAAKPYDGNELAELEKWLKAGNTAVILAALADVPQWAQPLASNTVAELGLLTGMEFSLAATKLAEQTQSDVIIVPNKKHDYFRDVEQIVALMPQEDSTWGLQQLPYQGFALVLAQARSSGEGAIWLRQMAAGRIVVSAVSSPWSNRGLGLADNARWFANLVASNLGRDGVVLFDDLHQGVRVGYDPQTFFADPRLRWTIAIVCLVWLIWVLGGTRLRMPKTANVLSREIDFVKTTGGFFARVLTPAVGAQALFAYFFKRLKRHKRREIANADSPPWDWLAAHPRVDQRQLAELQAVYLAAQNGSPRIRLTRLYNSMIDIYKAIS